jgi:hypothetical protein
MFHLLICANYCGGYLHLLIIQLIITASYTSSILVVDYDTTSNFSIMPVFTRSKARSMTNVYVEGVELCYCFSVPDHHRISRPVHTFTDVLSNISLLPSNISDNIGSSIHELLTESSSQVQVSHVSSSSSIF